MAIGEGIAGRVARTKEPILINGKPTSQEFPGLDARTQAVASAMSVPLVHRDQLLGVLNVNADAGSSFSAYELRALSMFAEQGAVAIANARLFDAERAHVVELVELDRLKSEFLGLVTHELRTPLTVVLAAAQAGKQPESPIETGELFEIIERNGKNLASLVEELLIAARLEQDVADDRPGPRRRRRAGAHRRPRLRCHRSTGRDGDPRGALDDRRPGRRPADPREPARQRAQVRRSADQGDAWSRGTTAWS